MGKIGIIAALVIVIVAASATSTIPTAAQTAVAATTNIRVNQGLNPGEVIVSWDAVPQATHYRIGYVNMVTDYPLAKASATGEWIEAFLYADVNARNFTVSGGRAQYTLRRLAQGVRHAFTVRTSDDIDGAYTWPSNPRWKFLVVADQGGACPSLAPTPAPTPTPTVTPAAINTPTPTPTPTPVATGDGSRRSSPIPYGQTFQAGNFDMQIVAVDEDAWPEVLAENQFNDAPASGYRFIMWTLKVENTRGSVDDDQYISDYSFDLVGSRGIEYQPFSQENSCGIIPNDLSVSLYRGGSAEGNVCLSVPTNETGFVLRYDTYHTDAAGDSFSVDIWFAALPTG